MRYSTEGVFKEAVHWADTWDYDPNPIVIFVAPRKSQAEYYRGEFQESYPSSVRSATGRVFLHGRGGYIFESASNPDRLRGLRGRLFRAVPDSRDDRNNYEWEEDTQWPGLHPYLYPSNRPKSRFDRIDNDLF
jgi:hypothetical protein